MDRSSTYLAVDQLKAAGLMEVDELKRPKLVQAIEPKKLLGRVERKIQILEENFDTIHNFMPELERAYKTKSSRPGLQTYSGKDGLQQIMEDILEGSNDEILLFTNQSVEKDVFSKHDHTYFIRKRRERNLSIRVLATDDEYAKNLMKEDSSNLRTTRLIKGVAPFSCEVYIYKEKVAMLSFSNEVIGFGINSPDFAELMRWQFNITWNKE